MSRIPTDLVDDASIATHIAGPPPESTDFDFLLGNWTTTIRRFDADGHERLRQRGRWTGRKLHGGRIILDETVSYREDGTEVASMATLRSYSPSTQRWQMTFLVAHQPALPIRFFGQRTGDELHLEVIALAGTPSPLLARVRFFEIRPDRFEWEQATRQEGSTSLRRTVSIQARRAD